MATHKSAIKRIRQSEKNRERNVRIRSSVKTSVKKLREAIEAKETETAKTTLATVIRAINKARSSGVLHPNTASRKISRLTTEFNALKS